MSFATVVYENYTNVSWSAAPSCKPGECGPPLSKVRSIYGIFGSIFIVGVLGNMLVIIAASRRLQGMHKTMSVFITNLSFADLMFLTFCMPFAATVLTLPSWIFGNFMCKFQNFTMYTSMLASIYTLVAMSFDRYIAVVYPLKFVNVRTLRKSVLVTVIIWTLALSFSTPYLYVMTIEHENYTTHTETYCVERWHQPRHRPRYHIFIFLCGYALPLVAICIAYLRILCVLWRKFQPTPDGTQNNISNSKRKVTLMVCVVVTAFGFCWLPHHIINLWMGFGDFELSKGTFIFKIFALSVSSLNSAINPIIYSMMSDNFRRALCKAVRHVMWKRSIRRASRNQSSNKKRTGPSLLRSRFQHQHRHELHMNCNGNNASEPCIRNGRVVYNNNTMNRTGTTSGSRTTRGTMNGYNKPNQQCPPFASSAV